MRGERRLLMQLKEPNLQADLNREENEAVMKAEALALSDLPPKSHRRRPVRVDCARRLKHRLQLR